MNEWRITDLTETEIRGTEDKPIIVSRPYWSLMEMKYPNFTAVVHTGKKKFSHTFQSDDIEMALKVMNEGGEEKEISKTLSTNIVYGERLMKHCVKLQKKLDKAARLTTKSKTCVKPSSKSKPKPKNKVKPEKNKNDNLAQSFKVDISQDIKITLDNWI